MTEKKRYKVIACEILFRETCYCAALSKNIIDIEFMEKGLHDIGSAKMVQKLQVIIDRVDVDMYDAILFVYGLCNNGVLGLKSKLSLVIPRAHDCITLLMGSKEKYMEYHQNNPSAYYMSTGWMERDTNRNGSADSIPSQLGLNKTYQEYAGQYGEENAKFLMETLGDWTSNYDKYTYIDTQTGNMERYIADTKKLADEKGWKYETVLGNVMILQKLMDGEWDEKDFLVIPPGSKIEASYDGDIVKIKNG